MTEDKSDVLKHVNVLEFINKSSMSLKSLYLYKMLLPFVFRTQFKVTYSDLQLFRSTLGELGFLIKFFVAIQVPNLQFYFVFCPSDIKKVQNYMGTS